MDRAGAVRAAEGEGGEHQHGERAELRPRGDSNDEGAEVGASHVDGGREHNRPGRQAARQEDVSRGVDAETAQQVFTEHDGDAAKRRGANQDELRPAKEEGGAASPGFAQVGVDAARFRQRRGNLGQRERAAQRDGAPGYPKADHHQRIWRLARDAGGGAENA